MSKSKNDENSLITRSAFKVLAGGFLSLSAGLVNQVVIAAFFGASVGMDSFLTANVVPLYFQYVLLSGLSFVFIPAFVREATSGREDDAWALAGTFFWILSILIIIIATVGAIFSAQIIAITAPGFAPDKSALAAKMLSVLMFTLPFTGLGSFCTGIQNARNRFFWPSFAGALNSLANLAVIVTLGKTFGPMALCWAFLASVIVEASITITPVIRHGWKRLLPLAEHRVLEMGKLITPLILFGLLTRSTSMVERYFASILPDGQVAYIGYANKTANIFVTLLAMGISLAIFPSMARAFVLDGVRGLEEKNSYGLRLTFAVGLPAVLITGAVAIPMIHVLFQRGEFHSSDTLGVSQILVAVLLSDVLLRMVLNVFSRTSYVLKDTISPTVISCVTVTLYIATGGFFVSKWGYSGLVWARTLQMTLSLLLLWIVIQRKLPNTHLKASLWNIFEYILAACAAFLASRLVVDQLRSLPAVFQLAIAGLIGLSLYLFILYWRDREMLTAIVEISGVERILAYKQNGKFIHSQKSIKGDVPQE